MKHTKIELLLSTTIGGHAVYDKDGFPALIKRDLSRFKHLLQGQVLICNENAAKVLYPLRHELDVTLCTGPFATPYELYIEAQRFDVEKVFVLGAPQLAMSKFFLQHPNLDAVHLSQYFARVPENEMIIDAELQFNEIDLLVWNLQRESFEWEQLDHRVGPTWGSNKHSVWRRRR